MNADKTKEVAANFAKANGNTTPSTPFTNEPSEHTGDTLFGILDSVSDLLTSDPGITNLFSNMVASKLVKNTARNMRREISSAQQNWTEQDPKKLVIDVMVNQTLAMGNVAIETNLAIAGNQQYLLTNGGNGKGFGKQ